MYPAYPIREDLEAGIRSAPDLEALKTAILTAFESLMWDVREQAGRIDEVERRLGNRR
jgi:hypothetical protein